MPGFSAGDKVTATLDTTLYTGVILGFNGSGLSALVRLTADAAPGYPEGASVPIPVRMLAVA